MKTPQFHDEWKKVTVRKSVRHMIYDALTHDGKVSVKRLIDICWGDDPDGGPLDAPARLGGAILSLRRAGFRIDTLRECQSDGSTITFYRLRRFDAE